MDTPPGLTIFILCTSGTPVNMSSAMPRDGAIIFNDLIGKLDVLRVACAKCGRDGRYRLDRLIKIVGAILDRALHFFRCGVLQCCFKISKPLLLDQFDTRFRLFSVPGFGKPMPARLDIAGELEPSIPYEPSSPRVADSFPALIALEIVPFEMLRCFAASPSVIMFGFDLCWFAWMETVAREWLPDR